MVPALDPANHSPPCIRPVQRGAVSSAQKKPGEISNGKCTVNGVYCKTCEVKLRVHEWIVPTQVNVNASVSNFILEARKGK